MLTIDHPDGVERFMVLCDIKTQQELICTAMVRYGLIHYGTDYNHRLAREL